MMRWHDNAFVQMIPVSFGASRVKPVLPVAGTSNSAHRPPGSACHVKSFPRDVPAAGPAIPAMTRQTSMLLVRLILNDNSCDRLELIGAESEQKYKR